MNSDMKLTIVNNSPRHTINKQQGAVLIVSLIMLLVMTLIGLSAMRTTILEEKMAGNYRDSNLAFQAAEAALRDAENDLVCTGAGCRASPITGINNFETNCTAGLCAGWSNAVWTDLTKMANVVAYSTYSNAAAVPEVAAPPNYIIEGKKCIAPGWASWKYCYQITATGFGGSLNAKRFLQEVYLSP